MTATGEAAFHEIRYFKRGRFAQCFAVISLVCIGIAIFVDWYRPLFVLAAAVLLIPIFLLFETRIGDGELRMEVRPFWRKTVSLSEVVGTEVTIWDGQIGFFGGFSTRMSVAGALLGALEGDSSVGNKAVVLELRSGKQVQVGTHAPKAFVQALERGTGRELQ